MLQVVLLCVLVGQTPPPPRPYELPPAISPNSSDQPPTAADPQGQRNWLRYHLTDDLEAQGKLDAAKYAQIERMLGGVSDAQVDQLVQTYQRSTAQAQAQQLAVAQANLQRVKSYRDYLQREVGRQQQVHEQEQAITAAGSALAAQQAQWAMQNFYAVQTWPYYYYPAYPYRRHHRW